MAGFTPNSPLAARVVEAPCHGERPNGLDDIAGIAIHMAEGGGTVSWLSRQPGNSSHYVVEYDGDLVQMVRESHWACSINPNSLRVTDDAPYTYLGEKITYGRTAGIDALTLAGYRSPNIHVIAIEVEGFAATGPNPAQRQKLKALVSDIRHRRNKPLPCLGHRDFQSYKNCPGHRVPWVDYGGHARHVWGAIVTSPAPQEADMQGFNVPELRTQVHLKTRNTNGDSQWLYPTSDCKADDPQRVSLSPVKAGGQPRPLPLVGFQSAVVYIVAYESAAADPNDISRAMFVPVTSIASTQPVPDPTPVSQAAYDEAQKKIVALQKELTAASAPHEYGVVTSVAGKLVASGTVKLP